MRKYISILFLMFNLFVFSQQKDDIIKQSTYSFTLDSIGGLKGVGANFLKDKINESQFFLIGEQHNVHSIETLISSLLPLFKKNGYNHYVTEIGPIAAKKLINLNQNSISLKAYNSKYSSQINLPPFGFFSTKEEEITLQQLHKNGINLSGIDFENYGSYLALIDELYLNSYKGKISKNLYNDVYSLVETEYKKGDNNFNPDLMKSLLNSNKLKHFLHLAQNDINNPIISQFELSLKINYELTLGFWQNRVDNMKTNFINYYHNQNDNSQKTIIKLGAVHTARGTSFSGNLEVGNLVYELANLNQTKSYSTIIFPRYIINNQTGIIEDVIDEEDRELLKFAFKEQWTIIDLNKLKELSIQNKIQLDVNIKSYIQKYDAIIIPPNTKFSEIIY